ncbi:protein translocase subunit SecD [bacterium]|nr:protein translocase subunit SecD [bacterium]
MTQKVRQDAPYSVKDSSMLWLLAQQVEQSAQAQPQTQSASGWLIFWLILAVIFLPYILGSVLASVLKLKQFSNRFGTILFALAATLVPVGYQLGSGKEFKDCFRLGIDLKGGTNLVYQVDHDRLKKQEAKEGEAKDLGRSLNNMVGAIARRVNPSGTEEVTVRTVGADRIEVIIPGADQAYTEEMKARITKLGTLEFQILAAEESPEHREWIREARELPATLTDTDILSNGIVVARWVTVAEGESVGAGGGELLRGLVREVTTKNSDGEDVSVQQALVVLTPKSDEVTGEFLTRATEQQDPQTGRMVVGFRFNQTGANRFGRLTEKYRPTDAEQKYRLAVLLDGKIQTAPALNEPIYGQGQISGNFTREEVRQLVDVLNAGALDVPLNTTPISEFTISPLLGADVQKKGVTAISISAILVVAFMAVYYLKAGLIAVLCLLMNLVLIMGTMIFVQGTFTLPGLAGLVLTIGMAVDANVLIFERMREELARGASVRMAVHNGFDKAFSAIVDSNITTLIVAVILFMIGTDQVKGFAVTLFIGIVMSMFSALYFGRTVFEVLDQKRILKKLPMLSLVKSPSIDFIGKQKLAFAFSGLLIFAGLATFFSRGDNNLDIDFRGGTMVTFEFEEPHALTEFRSQLEEKFDSSITVERLTLEGESQQADAGRRWRLRTVNDKAKDVENGVAEALSSMALKKVTLTAGDVTPIADAADTTGADAAEAKPRSAFAGGLQSSLKFSDEISLVTAVENLNDAIKALPDSQSRYPEPSALYRLTGTAGKGVNAEEGQVKTYNEVLLEARPDGLTEADLKAALSSVEHKMATTPLFEEVTNFSQSVGGEMQEQAILAMVLSLAAIIVYIWLRFQRVTFGFAAVAALVHDVAVVLGSVALAASVSGSGIGSLFAFNDFKINLPMIAAFLTIVGYSLNDTIVIFDRIREVRGKNPSLTTDMINVSLNQTLSRTLLTSFTTFIVVAILYAFGGEGIHGFAFCLLVGVIIGTYSSIYVASPILLWLMNRANQRPATAPVQR